MGIGGKGEAFSSPWGAPIDLDAFAEKLASGPYKLVTMVHNETSTGAVYQAGKSRGWCTRMGPCFSWTRCPPWVGRTFRWIPGTLTWR